MRFFLRPLVAAVAVGSAVCATSLQAYDLRIDRTVFAGSGDVITPRGWFPQPSQGDLYLATRIGNTLYFVTPEGLRPQARPLVANGQFSGAWDLTSFDSADFAPGRYPFHMVVTAPGAGVPDMTDGEAWESLELSIGLSPAQANDLDHDGWDDDDLTFDGYPDPAARASVADPAVTTPTAGRLLASQCAQCHGTDGISASGIDGLRGESANEIVEEAHEYAYEEAGIMHFQALGYSAAEIRQIGEWFASLGPAAGHGTGDEQDGWEEDGHDDGHDDWEDDEHDEYDDREDDEHDDWERESHDDEEDDWGYSEYGQSPYENSHTGNWADYLNSLWDQAGS